MERCRFCYIETNREFFIDIFNNGPTADITITKIVEMLTSLQITESDPYTKLCCLNCFHTLIHFYHYRETILQTNLIIKNEINNNCNNYDHGYSNDYIGEDSLRLTIKTESGYKHQQQTIIDDNKSNLDQQLNKNCLGIEEPHGFIIKNEMDIEETFIKIENDFNDADEQIYEDNHPNISIGDSINETITNSDNKFCNNKDLDRFCLDIKQDEPDIIKITSIIDTASNKNLDIQEDNSNSMKSVNINDDKTKNNDNNDKNFIINEKNCNEKHVECTDLECRKKEKPNQKSNMSTDLKKYTSERHHQCNICKKAFTKKWNLKQHLLIHTGEKAHQCNICDKKFKLKTHLRQHLFTHTNEKPHQCNIYDNKFLTIINSDNQFCNNENFDRFCLDIKEDESNIKEFPSIDTDSNNDQYIPIEHSYSKKSVDVNIVNDNKTIQNDNSDKHLVANEQDCNEEHLENTTSLQCQKKEKMDPKCWKILSKKSNITDDFKKYLSEQHYYQCNICEKMCTQKSYLKLHIMTHSGEKPHQCNICEKHFKFQTHLRKHLLTHFDEKPHHCYICRKKCTNKFELKRHLLTHTGDKPYQCDICKKKFSSKSALSNHLKGHKNERDH